MNTLLNWVVSNTIAAALLVAFVLILTKIWRRPQVLHALWIVVMIKLITPPIVPVQLPELGFRSDTTRHINPMPPAERSAVTASMEPDPEYIVSRLPEQKSISSQGPADPEPVTSVPEPALATTMVPIQRIKAKTVAAAVWLTGTLMVLLVTAAQVRRLRSVLRAASPADSALNDQLASVGQRIKVSRLPTIHLSAGPIAPFVVAQLGRLPALVLPQALVAELSVDQRSAVLAHELSHLRRGDHFVRWLEVVATALLWWHPLVWIARRQIHRLEEECCDDAVVRSMPELKHAYALAIARVFERLGTGVSARSHVMLTSGLGSPMSELVRRIHRIKTGTPNPIVHPIPKVALSILCLHVVALSVGIGQDEDTSEGNSSTSSTAAALTPVIPEINPRIFEAVPQDDLPVGSKNAVELRIPAPRGIILDRNEEVIAGTENVHFLVLPSLNLPDPLSQEQSSFVFWLQSQYGMPIEQAWKFEHALTGRRESEFFPTRVGERVTDRQLKALQFDEPGKPETQEMAQRFYPEIGLTSRVIGSVQPTSTRKLDTLLFSSSEGANGLEEAFDSSLTGEPGLVHLWRDESDLERARFEVIRQPIPGQRIKTTLNAGMHRIAARNFEGSSGSLVGMS